MGKSADPQPTPTSTEKRDEVKPFHE